MYAIVFSQLVFSPAGELFDTRSVVVRPGARMAQEQGPANIGFSSPHDTGVAGFSCSRASWHAKCERTPSSRSLLHLLDGIVDRSNSTNRKEATISRKYRPSKARFTLWLSNDALAKLEKLQRTKGKGAVAEVVREALEVYFSLLDARDAGVELFYIDRRTEEQGRIWILPGPVPGASLTKST